MLINNPSFGALKQPQITLLVINYSGVLSVTNKVVATVRTSLCETITLIPFIGLYEVFYSDYQSKF